MGDVVDPELRFKPETDHSIGPTASCTFSMVRLRSGFKWAA